MFRLYLVVFLNMPILLFAQNMQIRNITTGEPIENVAIYNKTREISSLSDQNGFFDLSKFSAIDTVYFQHASYLKDSIPYAKLSHQKTVYLERKIIILQEFVISASKFMEEQREVANMVDVLSQQKLKLIPAQTSADILTSTGNIFVQKSQGAGGSPVLRGFEANKILLVVDGVRMNNAIYRSGHLQNSITIDNAILSRAEIIYGPSAVIYGTDALGGVIHYITRDPDLADEKNKQNNSIEAYVQGSSANLGTKAHLNFNLASKKFGSLSAITVSNFNDIRMGTKRDPFLEDFGKCLHYVDQVNGQDSILVNSNSNIQKNTGYSQYDFFQKFRFKPSKKLDFILNLQYSSSSDVPRYDQLNDYTSENYLKYAEWYYGPQNRFLGSFKTSVVADKGIFTSLAGTLAFQNIDESRYSRKYQASNRNEQVENVHVYSLNLDFIKIFNKNDRLNYGLEVNYNTISSNAVDRNIFTNETIESLTRYPDQGSKTNSYSAYLTYKRKLSDRFLMSAGLRYNYATLLGTYGDIYNFTGIDEIDMKNQAVTGAFSLIYQQSRSFKLNIVASTGYRNPNLDDVAKVRAISGDVLLPNPDVKPEYTYNAELGLSKTYDGTIQINGTYFFTYINDAIVRKPYTFSDGADSLKYDGDYYTSYVNGNANQAIIHGFSLNLVSDFNSNISFRSTLNYTWGKDITNHEPLAHIPPIFGKTNFTYRVKKFTNEFYLFYSGWKKTSDMSYTGEDNDEEGTQYGFPGWFTINVRTSFEINPSLIFQLAVENISDNFYKQFASAIASPGINVIGTMRIRI